MVHEYTNGPRMRVTMEISVDIYPPRWRNTHNDVKLPHTYNYVANCTTLETTALILAVIKYIFNYE